MSLLPQFGFFELIMVAVIALIVVGPEDLPKLMRMAGRTLAQARKMAAEFTSAFDDMAREAEMKELRAEIDSLKSDNVFTETKNSIEEAVAPVHKAMNEEVAKVNQAASTPTSSPAISKANDAGDSQ